MLSTKTSDTTTYAKPKPILCIHGCKCPVCKTSLIVEEHGAHYCIKCKDYEIPQPHCPGW